MFGLFETYDQAAQATVLSAKLSNFRAPSTNVSVKYEFVLDPEHPYPLNHTRRMMLYRR